VRKNNAIVVTDSIREFAAKRAITNGVSNVWAEFGVQDGESARQIQEFLPLDGKFYLYDSFQGNPGHWYANKGPGHRRSNGVPVFEDSRITIIAGWFEDTLTLRDVLGFVHIDCDLYSSTKTVLDRICVVPGTVILFDELWGYGQGPNSEAWKEHEYKALMEWNTPFKFIAKDSQTRALIEIQ